MGRSDHRPFIMPWRGIGPRIADDAFIAPTASVIGDAEIGSEASVWFQVVIRADVNSVRIGARANIQDGTVIHVTSISFPTLIGANVTIGHGVILHGCTLMDDCFIGMDATVMDGAVVESGAMVAAGALVTPGKRVRSGELWGGTPAQLMRPMRQAEADNIAASADRYVRLAAEYRESLSGSRP
jgi:carbonic anhydrase/acetyltransferase-like protein (isoleucine patch superfamily)